MPPPVKVCNLGRMSYSRAMAIQEQVRRAKLDALDSGKLNTTDTLILVEHTPVYTIGIRSKEYSREVEMKLRRLGADFQQVHRGGLITFHGPGQLVAYPVMDLRRLGIKDLDNKSARQGLGVRGYVQALERTVIGTCAAFDVTVGTTQDTGVWVDGDRKIAAIGVNARRYVTSHGLALNCDVDLDWFSHIVPCGLKGKSVTSLSRELARDVTISDVIPAFLKAFTTIFDCELKLK